MLTPAIGGQFFASRASARDPLATARNERAHPGVEAASHQLPIAVNGSAYCAPSRLRPVGAVRDRRFPYEGDATNKLLDIAREVEATTYVSGPAARAYLDEAAFSRAKIAVEFVDLNGFYELKGET